MNALKGRILVIGATSGVGQAFCDRALDLGFRLTLAARTIDGAIRVARDLEIRKQVASIPVLMCDVADASSHAAFVESAMKHDDLVGCFVACGVMHEQEACEAEWALAAETIACNYTGTVSLVARLAPVLAEAEGGFISCLTSVAGDRGRQSNYLYGSTKAGLNAWLEGLQNSFFAAGLLVQTIKLGPVDTPMNTGVERAPFMISPERAARAIHDAIRRREQVVYVPRKWAAIMAVIRMLPRWLFNRLKL